MNPQVCPDYGMVLGKVQFEENFNCVFSGPGFYLTSRDTVLVTPSPADGIVSDVWQKKWPEDTLWNVSVYNLPFAETIFAVLAITPVRNDERN